VRALAHRSGDDSKILVNVNIDISLFEAITGGVEDGHRDAASVAVGARLDVVSPIVPQKFDIGSSQ
jgi:hypothetical protein